MNAVAISRLDDDEVGLGDRLRVQHEGVGIAAEIAGEDDTPAGPFDIGCRGAEDVSGKAKGDPRAARQFGGFGELDRAKGLDRALRVAYAIERPGRLVPRGADAVERSEEHTSELQSLMRSSYAVFCLKKKKKI